jgi:hypothetical protein
MTDDHAAFTAMLEAAGLKPSDAERAELAAAYATFKPGVDALYALPEAKYEDPALVFVSDPHLTPWRA